LALWDARYATILFFYELPDNFSENTTKEQALSKKPNSNNTLQQDLKSQNTSLIVCANCLQKKPNNIEKKRPKTKLFF